MAQNFIGCDREQELLLPPSLREWLPQEHLACFVLDAVDEVDLGAFYAGYREDGWGRAAHDPAMMVYAYAIGVHTARIDAEEDELFGEACGDELPEGLRTSGDRRRVLREAKQALDAERAARAKKIPRDRGDRLVECRRRLRQDWELERYVVTEHAAWHAAGIASDGSRRTAGARHNIKPYPLAAEPAGKVNVTDPDSRNLKTTRGWVQGYNAQAVVGEGQMMLAAEISVESLDTASLQPMIETAIRELAGAGVTDTPGVVLADAGYCKNDAIDAIVAQGSQILVAPDADRRKESRPGRRGGLYDFARRVLATDWGKELYLRRQGIIEPVFGQVKSNRGVNRFLRRGRSAVRSEWRLLTATHNLLKLHRHQLAAA